MQSKLLLMLDQRTVENAGKLQLLLSVICWLLGDKKKCIEKRRVQTQ